MAQLAAPKVFPLLRSLCSLTSLDLVDSLPAGGSRHREWGIDFAIVFPARAEAVIDRGRAEKELEEVVATLERVRTRLANPGFSDKAPAAVVEGARKQLAELEEKRSRLSGALATAAAPAANHAAGAGE